MRNAGSRAERIVFVVAEPCENTAQSGDRNAANSAFRLARRLLLLVMRRSHAAGRFLMHRISTLCIAAAVALAGLAACSGDSSREPVTAKLVADPEVCDVPCEVVLDSGIEAEQRMLTFTWDVGEGPVEGEERLLHRFDAAGTYDISVTVTGNGQSTTDTITVRVEPQPKSDVLVDEAGGTVSQGAGKVTVPPDVAPEAVRVELTELPSMQEAAERVLGTDRFTALGKAYRVSMPLKTGTAIDISVTDSEATGQHPANLAWLVRLVGSPVLPPDYPPVSSRAPVVDYVLVPVSRVDESGAAHGDIFAGRRFQLVMVPEPLQGESFQIDATSAITPTSSPGQFMTKASKPPFVRVFFWDPPTFLSESEFTAAAKMGVSESYRVLVGTMGFVAPEGTIDIVVGGVPNGKKWLGAVATNDHHTIRLIHTLNTEDQVMKIVAHEFFHLIQHLNTNQTSVLGYDQRDSWFTEGTSDWAMDEVFDALPNHYHPTRWQRFETRLNQEGKKKNLEYETVGFWKWAESYRPGIIRQIIEHKYLLTHTTVAGAKSMVESQELRDYLTSLKALWADLDFLTYVYDARYEKDFDTDETGKLHLWGPKPYLGDKKQVFLHAERDQLVAADVVGNTASNPLKIGFTLKQRLTAEALRIGSLDLTGDLHIKLPVTPTAPLDAHVLILDSSSRQIEEEYIVRDLSKSHPEVKAKFDPNKQAVLFIAEGTWTHGVPDAPVSGEIEAWVEDPCGALPSNIIDVTPDDDLFVALTTAPAGSAVRLGPGIYYPPLMQWPTPEFGPFGANVLVRELTLIGSGEGQTRIVMTGDEYGGIGLKTYGNATLRNFTIEAGQAEPAIDCLDAKHVTMCNVSLEASSSTDWGLIWGPWHGGSTSLSLHDCTFIHPNREQIGTAIQLQSCYDPPASVSAEISLTRISGWGSGVDFQNGSSGCGPISVSADCDGFSNNDYNVVETVCSDGSCDYTDHCPNPTP